MNIAARRVDFEGERRSLERALLGKAQFIEPDLRVAALSRLFLLDVKTMRYASALDRYELLREEAGDESVPAPVVETVRKIEALASSPTDLAIEGRIDDSKPDAGEHGVWSHKLFRRIVGLSSDSLDQLHEYDLRCDFHRAKGKPKPNRALRIPEEWGECRMYVFGERGATFELIEYGPGLGEG